ncbi:MAG: WD40 repeat domain-containing protein [Sediminibacterium sp.]
METQVKRKRNTGLWLGITGIIIIVAPILYIHLFYKTEQVNGNFARLEKTIAVHDAPVWVSKFVPGTDLIASCSVDSTVKFTDVHTGKVWKTFKHPEGVTCLDISKDGKLLATTSYDAKVRVWKIADGSLLREWTGHERTAWCVKFSPDGRMVASGSEDGTIRLWNIESGDADRTIKAHKLTVWDLQFSPDGKQLASGSFDNSLKIWDPATGNLLRQIIAHSQAVVALAFSHSGQLLASTSDDATIKIWNTSNWDVVRTLDVPEHAQGVAFSPDDKRLLTGGHDKTMLGELVQNFVGTASSNKGTGMRLWEVSTGKILQTFVQQDDDINDVSFNADGTLMASASEDQTVCIWRVIK